ncbi:MAG TPA: type II secretion system protein [Chthoniobacteraceae bacterium]|nr:type II secretion system protein [Chthoniobacteraceae bacterium]
MMSSAGFPSSFLRCRRDGVSVLEMMIAIVIAVILAGSIMAVVQRSRQSAERAGCLSQIRQIGSALHLYAQEHNGSFPGPLPGNQGAYYTRASNTLARHLKSYLFLPEPVGSERLIAKELECAAARRMILAHGGTAADAVYYNCPTTKINGAGYRPLGYIASGATSLPPASLIALGSEGVLSKVKVLLDADWLLSAALVGNRNVAREPVHGKVRNALFADGHVEGIPLE